jgi:hypothetical protein
MCTHNLSINIKVWLVILEVPEARLSCPIWYVSWVLISDLESKRTLGLPLAALLPTPDGAFDSRASVPRNADA